MTSTPRELAEQIRHDFGWQVDVSLAELEAGHNRNFTATVGREMFHVRVYRPSSFADAVACELDALAALGASGVPVCGPIRRPDGRLFGTVTVDDGYRHYALFEFADGESPRDWTSELASTFGSAVAQIHVTTDALEVGGCREALDERTLVTTPVEVLSRCEPDENLTATLERTRDELHAQLSRLPVGSSSWGFIHADLHAMNLHVAASGELRIFDFDSSALGPRAHDLALAWMTVPRQHWRRFLTGYRSAREPATGELEAVPALAKARMIRDCAASVHGTHRPSGAWSLARLAQICSKIDALGGALD